MKLPPEESPTFKPLFDGHYIEHKVPKPDQESLLYAINTLPVAPYSCHIWLNANDIPLPHDEPALVTSFQKNVLRDFHGYSFPIHLDSLKTYLKSCEKAQVRPFYSLKYSIEHGLEEIHALDKGIEAQKQYPNLLPARFTPWERGFSIVDLPFETIIAAEKPYQIILRFHGRHPQNFPDGFQDFRIILNQIIALQRYQILEGLFQFFKHPTRTNELELGTKARRWPGINLTLCQETINKHDQLRSLFDNWLQQLEKT